MLIDVFERMDGEEVKIPEVLGLGVRLGQEIVIAT
jgi:hypothetical protein